MDNAHVSLLILLLVWYLKYHVVSLTSITISDPRIPNGYDNNARVTVTQGEPTTFTCTMQSNTTFTIEWLLDTRQVDSNMEDQSTPAPNGLIVVTSSYELTASRSDHNNEFQCVATGNGLMESTSILILVEGPPDSPKIQGDATIVTIVEMQEVSFVCTSTGGFPAPVIQWRILEEDVKDEVDLTSNAKTEVSNSTQWRYEVISTLALTPTRDYNKRSLQCATGSLTDDVELNVRFCPDMVTLQCPNQIKNGTEIEFSCSSTEENPPLNLFWNLDDKNISPDSRKNEKEGTMFGGVFRIEKYTTLVTREMNGRSLKCRSTQNRNSPAIDCRDVTDDCNINVLYQPVIRELPTVYRKEGEPLLVTCSFDANPTDTNITWTKASSLPGQVIDATPNLTFIKISRNEAGMYSCRAKNGIGESTENVDIFVNWPALPGTLDRPTSTPGRVNTTNVIEGGNITIACEAEAYPPCSVNWYTPNNTLITVNDRMIIEETVIEETVVDRFRPRTQSNLVITGVILAEDSGVFRCEATNSVGAENIMFAVIVEAIPGGRSNIVAAVTVVMIAIILIAIIAIFAVKQKRKRKYSGKTRQAVQAQNRVIAELVENHEAINMYTNSPRPTPSANNKDQRDKVDYDTPYANITANFAFPRNNLKINKELGQGAFGKVLLAKAKGIMGSNGETEVAVKTLKEGAPSADKEDLLREVELMKILKPHPNVVRLLGCCPEADPIYVIVEYMSNGNLKVFLRKSRNKNKDAIYDNLHGISVTLTLRQLVMFAKQTAAGMMYLSSQKCIHRDLAARNILVSSDLTCKVSDFGLARDVMNVRVYQRAREEFRLPLRWMALESLVEDVFSTESDVWSFGILLWEIITLGARPYPGTDTKDIVSGLKCGMRMPCPKHCPPEIYNIMTACWQAHPKDRPSFEEIENMLQDLLQTDTMHIAMDPPEESLYTITEISLANEKL